MLTRLTKSFNDKIIYHSERIDHFKNAVKLINTIDTDHMQSIISLVNTKDVNNYDLATTMLSAIHPKMWIDIIVNIESLRKNYNFLCYCGIQINPFNDNDYGVYSTAIITADDIL